jgi:glycosyltransferase involved in cell wall biosynthesis
MSDCLRDVALAREFGFKGECLGLFPGPGGYKIAQMRAFGSGVPPSKRRVIVVKGQEHWAGRALKALTAIQHCADQLEGYEIVVYYTTENVHAVVRHMQQTTQLNIKALQGAQPHDDIIRLMGQARVALGLAISDGVPNAMLEAMTMGAFPIQSDTGATGEWIDSGRNGLMVQPEDVKGVEAALRKALSDDALVDSAAEINRHLTDERIDENVVRPKVLAAYERVMSAI